MSRVLELDDETFVEVINSGSPVLVDVGADWCAPCRQLEPVIEQLSNDYSDIVFGKLDAELYPDISIKYGISSIPTTMLFLDGQLLTITRGFQPYVVFQNVFNEFLNGEE